MDWLAHSPAVDGGIFPDIHEKLEGVSYRVRWRDYFERNGCYVNHNPAVGKSHLKACREGLL